MFKQTPNLYNAFSYFTVQNIRLNAHETRDSSCFAGCFGLFSGFLNFKGQNLN